MEIFELDFRGKRLRAYLQDDSTLYFDLCDLARCLGMSVKRLKHDFSTEFIEVDEDHVSVVEDVNFFFFSPFEESYRSDLFMDIQPKIRLELANRNFQAGASESGGRFIQDENQILEENLKNARDKVAELEKMIADLRSEKLSLQDRYTKALQEQKTLLSELLDIRQGR